MNAHHGMNERNHTVDEVEDRLVAYLQLHMLKMASN